MELQDLYQLMERFSASGLAELEWERKDERIRLRRDAARPAGTAPAAEPVPSQLPAPARAEEGDVVRSPLVGVFYAASGPDQEPFAVPGRQVKKGEPLCVIEAMKLMSEVPAPADCVVEEVLARDGEPVGFGDPLVRIRRV